MNQELVNKETLQKALQKISKLKGDDFEDFIADHFENDSIEDMADFIAQSYHLENDDEITLLTEILIKGYILAKETLMIH